MRIKQVLIIIFALVIASFIGYNLRLLQTQGSFKSVIEPSQTEHHSPPSVVIEPGSAVETASYIIFHDDEPTKNYYAKNGDTGEIVKTSDNASEVIQYAIDQLTNGGKVFIKAGTYTITTSIIMADKVWLHGEGWALRGTLLDAAPGLNDDVIKKEGDHLRTARISYLMIRCNAEDQTAGSGIHISPASVILENLRIRNCKEYGIHLEELPGGGALGNFIRYNKIEGGQSGLMRVWHVSDSVFHANKFNQGTKYIDNTTGYLLDIRGGYNQWTDNQIYNGRTWKGHVRIAHNNNQFIGNKIDGDGTVEYALHLDGVTGNGVIQRNVIVGNIIMSQGSTYTTGIYVQGKDASNKAQKNIINFNEVVEKGGIVTNGIQVSDSDYNEFIGNVLIDTTTKVLGTFGSNDLVKDNIGYMTENSGNATIIAGQTSVTVNLPSDWASSNYKVILSPTSDTGGKRYWVSSKTQSSFIISLDSTHTSDISFDWYAEV